MQKIGLLLLPGFEVFEAAAFVDVFGWNNAEALGGANIETISTVGQVTSAFGQKWQADHLIHSVDPKGFDALAVPGGFEQFGFYQHAFHPQIATFLQEFAAQNKPIASVCVGSLVLGNAGLLQGKMATTYPLNNQRVQQLEAFGAIYQNQNLIITNTFILGQNPASAINVAFALLETLTNFENTKKVKTLMGYL